MQEKKALSSRGRWRRLLRVPGTTRRSNQSILKEISPELSLEGEGDAVCRVLPLQHSASSVTAGHVVFLELRRDSRVTTRISGFLLGWPWEAPSSIRVARESWGLPSSHCRAKETSSRLVFQCHSPKSSHPLPLPQSPKDCSIHQCLFCCLVHRVIVTIFLNSIYMR